MDGTEVFSNENQEEAGGDKENNFRKAAALWFIIASDPAGYGWIRRGKIGRAHV